MAANAASHHRRLDATPSLMRRATTLAALLLSATLLACGGGDSAAPKTTPTPFFTGTGPSATGTPPVTTPPANTPPVTTPSPNTPVPAGRNTGQVTVAGASYAFTVRTCTLINGQHYLVGDGEASVALASLLVVQTPARGSFIVDDPAVSARGATLTVSGTARNIVAPGERIPLTLTATCTDLAN